MIYSHSHRVENTLQLACINQNRSPFVCSTWWCLEQTSSCWNAFRFAWWSLPSTNRWNGFTMRIILLRYLVLISSQAWRLQRLELCSFPNQLKFCFVNDSFCCVNRRLLLRCAVAARRTFDVISRALALKLWIPMTRPDLGLMKRLLKFEVLRHY